MTTDGTFKAGISTTEYECIISDNDMVYSATVILRPVLAYAKRTVKDTQLCLSFIEDAEGKDEHVAGCILSLNPLKWCISTKHSDIQLLDPCSKEGNSLVLVPSGCSKFVTNSKNPALSLSINSEGLPELVAVKRAKAMLDAIKI